MARLELSEVVNGILNEKASINQHIQTIEKLLNSAQTEDELRSLYVELSPKLSRFYTLLQKHNEQLLEAIKIYYKEEELNHVTFDES